METTTSFQFYYFLTNSGKSNTKWNGTTGEKPRKGLDLLHLYLMVETRIQHYSTLYILLTQLDSLTHSFPSNGALTNTQFIKAHCFTVLYFQKVFSLLVFEGEVGAVVAANTHRERVTSFTTHAFHSFKFSLPFFA